MPYDVHAVEDRWRRWWEQRGTGLIDVASVSADDAFYNLVEFPYPSAEGLHVGHVFKYSGADAFGRYQRMLGRAVFQPIGFDAFGIHTENFALQRDRHPAALTAETTTSFREQLSRGGMAWDWRHTVDTSRPEYYRWTQWLFVTLFKAGLAYQADAPVLWCPSCLTVLAREQTEDGGTRCERCRTAVTERVMRQWFLRITAYADRLLDGLEGLDWPARAKRLQRQWIGRRPDGSFRLHDWLISRQRYWGPPIPIIHCDSCGPVPVPEDELPVVLPHIEDFRPTGSGVSPLAADEDWVRAPCPRCGGEGRRETDVSDTFFDSSWYFLRYPSTDVDDRPWDAERTARLLPVDFYAGGPEHVQRHHLYARFVTMALHDLGLVPFEEPFPRIRLGGMIVMNGAKMSKSRGNVIDPAVYWAASGSDVLRCAVLFAAPWEQDGEFNDEGIVGIERFLGRVWRRAVESPAGRSRPDVAADVAAAIESFRFNVGLAALMAAVSDIDATELVLLLAPFAPHLAEELWHRLGHDDSVHEQRWPAASSTGPSPDAVKVVQVDGKVRDRVPAATTVDEVCARPGVVAALAGRDVARVVEVADRLVNLVTASP